MRNTATPKQTGGGGITYEDKVAAFFLSCMLCDQLPFTYELGSIKSIDFQVRADGWQFDDLLLTLEAQGQIKRVAVSVKSNQQFTSKGCPTDINRDLWEQYLHVNSDVFNSETDMLCLVETPISSKIAEGLNDILKQVAHQDSAIFHTRIYTTGFSSKDKQKIYRSFRCPPDLATTYNILDTDTGKMLKHFLFLEKDYENQISNDESIAINICRSALQHKDLSTSKNLFNDLCLFPRNLSPVTGKIDRVNLIRQLRYKYDLKESPVYESDWKNISHAASEKKANIRGWLGQDFKIDNGESVTNIESLLQQSKGLIIQGISGAGKTNLMKDVAEHLKLGSSIWLDSSDFESISVEASLNLNYPLTEIIDQASGNECYLFVDGMERLLHERQHQQLFTILKKALEQDSHWKVVITCPVDHLERVIQLFIKYNVDYSQFVPFDLKGLLPEQLLALVRKYPSIHNLSISNAHRSIWNNLKLLDKVILNAATITNLSSSWGESQFIDFIWKEEIENLKNGFQADFFLKLLSELQADNLSIGINKRNIPQNTLDIADSLKNTGFLKLQNDKLYFVHDLYSDWGRYKLLKSHQDNLSEFIKDKHLTSPLWAKAIILFGISLLEQDESGNPWKDFFTSLDTHSPQHLVIQDLLLEAFFSAPDAFNLLLRHKHILFNEAGALFKRLIKLFFLKATQSNPNIIQLAHELKMSETEAAVYSRIPVFSYWPDVLMFLYSEAETVLNFDLNRVAEAACLWLEMVPEGFLLTQEAGDLSLLAAKRLLKPTPNSLWGSFVYKGLLLGYPYNPEEVQGLCLHLCRRTKELETKDDYTPENELSNVSEFDVSTFYHRTKPWKWGPNDRVDEAFRTNCLNGNALHPILKHNPDLGSEILLALLIEEPKDWHIGSHDFKERFQIVEIPDWRPPFYLRGPFLAFLHLSTKEALLFTCKIADFATEQWKEASSGDSHTPIVIQSDNCKREFWGGFQVFNWHRDSGTATHPLVSLLMALEQFLYEELEQERDIDDHVTFLIENTKSVAILGVLLTVGKSFLFLLLNQLKPFLAISIIYLWDSGYIYETSYESDSINIVWKEQIAKWKNRMHRNIKLKLLLPQILLHNLELEAYFLTVRARWQEELLQLISPKEDIFLLQLVHGMNPANYKEVEAEGRIYLQYTEPDEVVVQLKEVRKATLERIEDSNLTTKVLMMVKENSPFNAVDADLLWNKLQVIVSEVDIQAGEHCSGEDAWNSPLTQIFAIVKTLIHYKEKWLPIHPEYLDWIYNYIEIVVERQFEWEGQFEPHGTNEEWNVLLGELTPQLLILRQERTSFLRVVAGLLMLFNSETVKSFFNANSLSFAWNHNLFIQAQNLLLLYSSTYYEYDNLETPDYNVLKLLRKRLSEQFVKGQVSSSVMDWSTIRAPEQWKPKEVKQWHQKNNDKVRRAGPEKRILVPMMECIPALSLKKDDEEGAYILSLVVEAYKQVIYGLGEIKIDSLAIESLESEFDRFTLRKVALSLLYINDKSIKDSLWKPLLKFGYIAPNWIKVFCNAYFLNLDDPSVYPRMVEILAEMVSFTSLCPTWSTKHINTYNDFRISLLGFHPWIKNMWEYDYSAFTDQAEAIYKTWFLKGVLNHHIIDALLDFMITPSGKFMIGNGLQILCAFFFFKLKVSQESVPDGKVCDPHQEQDKKLGVTLIAIWQNNRNVLKKNQESFKFYRELVQYLVVVNNVIGIELQNSLMEN